MGFFTNTQQDKEYTERAAERMASQRARYDRAWPLGSGEGETSDREWWFKPFGCRERMLERWDLFDNWKNGWNNSSGLSAYPTPNTTEYRKCKQGDGVSVWDDKGWWRCLFPTKARHSDEPTQSDVESDFKHKYGLFFKDFNSLMDWKLEVRRLVELKRQEAISTKQVDNVNQIYDVYHKDSDLGGPSVWRTSETVKVHTLDNGDIEEITEIKKTYEDGTKEHKKFRKIIPKDGEPIVEDLSNIDKSGWIWNKK
jgi:hypothetical protein